MTDDDRLPMSCFVEGAGYLYAIHFDTDTVKVGRTVSPRNRIRSHITMAANFRASMVDHWLSEPHRGIEETEKLLKDAAYGLGGVAVTSEWFTDLDFARLVERAQALPIEPVEIPLHLRMRLSDAERRHDEAIEMAITPGTDIKRACALVDQTLAVLTPEQLERVDAYRASRDKARLKPFAA